MNKYSHLFNDKMSSNEARYVFLVEADKIPLSNIAEYELLKKAYYPVRKRILNKELDESNKVHHIW